MGSLMTHVIECTTTILAILYEEQSSVETHGSKQGGIILYTAPPKTHLYNGHAGPGERTKRTSNAWDASGRLRRCVWGFMGRKDIWCFSV